MPRAWGEAANGMGVLTTTTTTTMENLLFPSSERRQQGDHPFVPVDVLPTPWMSVGVPALQIQILGQAVDAHSYRYREAGNTFAWGDLPGEVEHNVELPLGTYAVVKCHGEKHVRALRAEPAALGCAAGHAGLAAGQPVAFAGEVQVGAGMELSAWTSVSGTYQIPDAHVGRSGLPASLY